MQLAYTPAQQEFRADIRAWLGVHAPKQPLVTLECREGFDQHVAWERTLASGNWGKVTWPEAYGGRGLDLGALMCAAQLVGLADAMLGQAAEYAKVRNQFGQPIGGFQAIKHQLASCAVAIEFAKPVVWRAAAALDNGIDSASVHVSHAKVAATDAAILTAETAIQVHGAMGYTYEVDLHFWMKRSWALAGAWGSRAFHLMRVDRAVLGGGLAIGPEHTFA